MAEFLIPLFAGRSIGFIGHYLDQLRHKTFPACGKHLLPMRFDKVRIKMTCKTSTGATLTVNDINWLDTLRLEG